MQNSFGLQLKFYDNGIDKVWTEYVIPEHFQGYPGVAHGGVIAAMLDEVCSRTAMISDSNHFMMTAKLDIKYRCPVPVDQLLRIMGKLTKSHDRILQAEGYIYLDDETIAAQASVTLVDIPESTLDESKLQQLGWELISD
jgi:acyl-coenzyme A thioesterase PaaI-like protein